MSAVNVHNVSRIVPKTRVENETMFLCSMDQRFGYYVRSLFFYDHQLDVEHLKSSLAEVLDAYHFWAGRIRFNDSGRMEIVCNNSGAFFALASSSLSLEEVTSDKFDDFFFFDNEKFTTLEELPLLTIQVTRLLGDESFAISMLNHHTLADATAGITFLLNFASVSRGDGLYLPPNGDRTRLRARDPPRVAFEHREFVKESDKSASNRFTRTPESVLQAETRRRMHLAGAARKPRKTITLSSSRLGEIKQAALDDGASCSTFEAMAAVLWRAHAASLPGKLSSDVMRLRFVMDTRNIVDPPLGDFCGNAVYGTIAEMTLAELLELPLSSIVGRVQEARKRVTDEYVRSGWDFLEVNRDAWFRPDCETIINAWPRVMRKSLDLDFGWGKPSRVEFPLDPRNPEIICFPLTKDGVVVSVNLEGEAFATFEKHCMRDLIAP